MSCRMAPGAAGRFFAHQSAAASICARACGEMRMCSGSLNRNDEDVPGVLPRI